MQPIIPTSQSFPPGSGATKTTGNTIRNLWLASAVSVYSSIFFDGVGVNLLAAERKITLIACGLVSGCVIGLINSSKLNSMISLTSTITNFSSIIFDSSPVGNVFLNALALGVHVAEHDIKHREKVEAQKKQEALKNDLNENGTLFQRLLNKLNQIVIGQTKAKLALAQAIAVHYQSLFNPSNSPSHLRKGNILISGPSGSGKTLIMESISQSLGLPMVVFDASRLTNDGIKGAKIDDAFQQLYEKANQNLLLAQKGIIFLDEIDKLFSEDNTHKYNAGAQNQLLTAMQGTDVKFKTSESLWASTITINTKDILFVLAGCFERLTTPTDSQKPNPEQPSLVSIDDFLSYGLKRELVGRIGHLIELSAPTYEEFRSILLQEESSISIPAWQKEFKKYDLELIVEDTLLDEIIAFGMDTGTGVRGLDFSLKQVLTPLLIESIDKLHTKELVPGNEVILSKEAWDKIAVIQQQHKNRAIPGLNDLKAHLHKKIIGQTSAKNTVAEAIYLHYLRQKQGDTTALSKANVLLMGPSGTGKTLIIEEISKKIDIPMATLDASKLTREGIVGLKAEDAILSLLQQARGNVKKAEKGIIFLDEIDKVFEDSNAPSHLSVGVAGKSIQNQLLRMLQGDVVHVEYGSKTKVVNTKNILFVMAGAFSNLIQQGMPDVMDDHLLIKAGISPEFLGRIGYIASTFRLTEDELVQALTHGPDSPLAQWQSIFKQHGKMLKLSQETSTKIVENALNNATGVRGLINQLRAHLTPYLAHLVQNSENDLQQSEAEELMV